MKKSTLGLATALVCLAAHAQGVSGDVVKIAVLSDMSSLYADTAGKGSVEAARMAIADFGGTVLGKKIELVSADHQNKADVAATKARQWFDSEGVDMVMNMNNSSVAIAVNGLARERNKMVMNTGAVSTALTNEHCGATLVHYTYDTYAMTNAAVKGVLADEKRDSTPTALVPGVTTRDITVPGAAGALPATVYTPEGKGPFPVVLYFHGGGWVFADRKVYDGGARGISKQANAVVVSVDYRRAPEDKFPAAHDDALAAYRWLSKNASAVNGDAKRLALAGESAGGKLAVATADNRRFNRKCWLFAW